MNDPNGLIQWGERFHLFYQYNPHAPSHGQIHWGHASSANLVHWQHEPIALAPDAAGPDADGCWSGCTVDDAGTPTLIYSGHRQGRVELPCLASSDDDLRIWRKHAGNPLFDAPPPGLDVVALRDHAVWREDDHWCMLMGAGLRARGGAALLYHSPDLRSWIYRGPLLEAGEAQHLLGWSGDVWECPDFFALDGQHVLLLSICTDRPYHSVALIGAYQGERFRPAQAQKLDHGDSFFYAPQSFRDRRGRRIVFGWVMEGRSQAAQQAAGWAGVMSLPRELALDSSGQLMIRPLAELAVLRGEHAPWRGLSVRAGLPTVLPHLAGDGLEIALSLRVNLAGSAGVALRRSPDGAEETRIVYLAERQELLIDRSRSSLSPDGDRAPHVAPLRLGAGDLLNLRIFLDRSLLEVFANDRVVLTTRIYPTRPDSQGVALLAEQQDVWLDSLDAWQLRSIW